MEADVCDKAAFLNLCARSGISLGSVEDAEGCSLRFSLRKADMERAEKLAKQCGGGLRVLRPGLGQRTEQSVKSHGFFLALAAALGLGLLASSLFLWEIDLSARPASVESWQIMGALDRAGLRRGSFVPGLHTELLCSRALEALPELESLTVNIRGSRAVVEARERVKRPKVREEKGKSEVVASRQAVLTDVRVLSGTPLVNKGMAVERGDILAQPSSTADRARAEIVGLCRVEKTALLPPSSGSVRPKGRKRTIWGFQWGKRCIFLQTDSSISPMVCGKIYSASECALPFGFCSLRLESMESGETAASAGEDCAEKLLEQLLARELGKDGELLSAVITRSGNALTLKGECSLQIGEEKEIK